MELPRLPNFRGVNYVKPLTTNEGKVAGTGHAVAVFGLLALLPIAAVFIPWDFGPIENRYRQLMAGHSLATPMIEILIFITFFKNENLVSNFVKRTNRNDKIVAAVFLSAILYSFFFVSISKMLFILGLLVLLIHSLFSVSLFNNMKYADQRILRYFWIVLGVSVIFYTALWALDFLIYPPTERDWIDRVPAVTNVRWTGFFWLSIFAAGLALARASGMKYFLPAASFGAFGLVMTLWTGTRGSLIAIGFGAICAIMLSPAYRKFTIKYCLVSAVIAVGINIYAPVPHKLYGMDRIVYRLQPDEVINHGGSGRTGLWKNTVEIALNHPSAGHGIDQFQKMGPKETLGFKGPHSLPLQLLFSVGIIGVLTFIYVIFRFLTIFRLEVKSPHQLAALVFLAGGSLYSLYDNFGYYPYSIAILTISIFMLFKPRTQLSPALT